MRYFVKAQNGGYGFYNDEMHRKWMPNMVETEAGPLDQGKWVLDIPEDAVEINEADYKAYMADQTRYVWQADGTLADAPTPQPEETPE